MEQLYVLEVLVNRVIINSFRGQKVVVVCKFGDIGIFRIDTLVTTETKGYNETDVHLGNGKSLLFPMKPSSLINYFEHGHIAISITKEVTETIAFVIVPWEPSFIDLVRRNFNETDPRVQPNLKKGVYKLMDTLKGDTIIGQITIFIRLTCLGHNITTPLQTLPLKVDQKKHEVSEVVTSMIDDYCEVNGVVPVVALASEESICESLHSHSQDRLLDVLGDIFMSKDEDVSGQYLHNSRKFYENQLNSTKINNGRVSNDDQVNTDRGIDGLKLNEGTLDLENFLVNDKVPVKPYGTPIFNVIHCATANSKLDTIITDIDENFAGSKVYTNAFPENVRRELKMEMSEENQMKNVLDGIITNMNYYQSPYKELIKPAELKGAPKTCTCCGGLSKSGKTCIDIIKPSEDDPYPVREVSRKSFTDKSNLSISSIPDYYSSVDNTYKIGQCPLPVCHSVLPEGKVDYQHSGTVEEVIHPSLESIAEIQSSTSTLVPQELREQKKRTKLKSKLHRSLGNVVHEIIIKNRHGVKEEEAKENLKKLKKKKTRDTVTGKSRYVYSKGSGYLSSYPKHLKCRSSCGMGTIPPYMGWLWTDMRQKIMNPKWRPGYVSKTVKKIMDRDRSESSIPLTSKKFNTNIASTITATKNYNKINRRSPPDSKITRNITPRKEVNNNPRQRLTAKNKNVTLSGLPRVAQVLPSPKRSNRAKFKARQSDSQKAVDKVATSEKKLVSLVELQNIEESCEYICNKVFMEVRKGNTMVVDDDMAKAIFDNVDEMEDEPDNLKVNSDNPALDDLDNNGEDDDDEYDDSNNSEEDENFDELVTEVIISKVMDTSDGVQKMMSVNEIMSVMQ